MKDEKKAEILTNLQCLIADWNILKNEDIGFRINSIQSKWHKANMNPSKLRKLMVAMGKKGGRPSKVMIKNLSDNIKSN